MTDVDLVPLKCSAEALADIASGLSRFGPAAGAPDWLVSGVWLCTADAEYLATSFTEVLADGYVARTLNIHTPRELIRAVEAELPDIEGRLKGRGNLQSLPQPCGELSPPTTLKHWNRQLASTKVFVRVAERLLATHKVPCALLFEGAEGSKLLVGTDSSTMAMVISEDDSLIEHYRESCEEVAAEDFRDFA